MPSSTTMTGGSASTCSDARSRERLRRQSRRSAHAGRAQHGRPRQPRRARNLPRDCVVARRAAGGTPNFGSFARGPGTARHVRGRSQDCAPASTNTRRSGWPSEVFNTFPSLYHLLPRATARRSISSMRAAGRERARGRARSCLRAARSSSAALLAAATSASSVIVGVNQETVTAVARRGDDFVYTVTRNGDGTVPTAWRRARRRTHLLTAQLSHSELTRDPIVAQAVADLLRRAARARLPSTPGAARSSAEARISDAALRRTPYRKGRLERARPEARRIFLQTLNEPPQLKLRLPARPRASTHQISAASASATLAVPVRTMRASASVPGRICCT